MSQPPFHFSRQRLSRSLSSLRIPHLGTSMRIPNRMRRPSHRRANSIALAPFRFPAPSPSPRFRQIPAAPDLSALTFVLPVPPSINHQYATVNGRRVLTAQGRAYKAHVCQELWLCLTRAQREPPTWLDNPHAYGLALSIWFYFVSPLRRDIDGGVKITQDAICEALGFNDNRIMELHVYKRRDPEYPRIECRLSLIEPTGIAHKPQPIP